MSRYIDAELVPSLFDEKFKETRKLICQGETHLDNLAEGFLEADRVIQKIPTADVVEVVHAYWKETTHITESKRGREIHSTLYNCSNCDAPNGRKKSRYCHWCGAKMDGERREK